MYAGAQTPKQRDMNVLAERMVGIRRPVQEPLLITQQDRLGTLAEATARVIALTDDVLRSTDRLSGIVNRVYGGLDGDGEAPMPPESERPGEAAALDRAISRLGVAAAHLGRMVDVLVGI